MSTDFPMAENDGWRDFPDLRDDLIKQYHEALAQGMGDDEAMVYTCAYLSARFDKVQDLRILFGLVRVIIVSKSSERNV